MDPIVGVWVTSLVGAGAFAAAGYVLGHKGIQIPLLSGLVGRLAPAERPPLAVAPHVNDDGIRETPTHRLSPAARAAADPSLGADLARAFAERSALEAELAAAKDQLATVTAQATALTQSLRTSEALRVEAERQRDGLQVNLRREIVVRVAAEERVGELGNRLASASEEASSLRHRVAELSAASKRSLRARPVSTSEALRRAEVAEVEQMRAQLRDVSERLVATSRPPPAAGASPAPPAASTRDSETPALGREVARLTAENHALRAIAIVNRKAARDATGPLPNIDVNALKRVVERVARVEDIHSAVVTDEIGSLVVGAGELGVELAAFGAYLKDASARVDQLLPFDAVEEIMMRDSGGKRLTCRVLRPGDLCLVILANTNGSLREAERVAAENLRVPFF